MSRIYNTTFNNFTGDTSSAQKNVFVGDTSLGSILVSQRNNPYIILKDINYYFATDDFINRLGLFTSLAFIPNNLFTQNIIFGTDSLEFANYIANTFGLNNSFPGVTNVLQLVTFYNFFTPLVNFNQNVTFGTNSSTFNYVSFTTTTNGPITSNKLTLFDTTNKSTALITLTGNYSSGQLTGINFTRTP